MSICRTCGTHIFEPGEPAIPTSPTSPTPPADDVAAARAWALQSYGECSQTAMELDEMNPGYAVPGEAIRVIQRHYATCLKALDAYQPPPVESTGAEATAEWRAWAKPQGWDAVADIEAELGRPPVTGEKAMMTPNSSDLARTVIAAANIVEARWQEADAAALQDAVQEMHELRCTAHAARMFECWLSAETVAALALFAGKGIDHEVGEVFNQHAFHVAGLVARDLAVSTQREVPK